MKLTLFILFLVVSCTFLLAQPIIGIRNFANTNDYNIGLKVGAGGTRTPLETYLFFDMRPFKKRVFVSDTGPFLLQLREKRFFIGGGLEYNFISDEKNVGGFVLMNLSYTWANYSGTAIKPKASFIGMPAFGLYFRLSETSNLKLGYSYFDSQSIDVENGKIYLAITTSLIN